MNRKYSFITLLLTLTIQAPLQAQSTICPAELPKAITKITNRPEFRQTKWGISVKPLSNNTPLYSYQAEKSLIPASNAKLVTTAVALLKLGPDYRIRTSVYGTPITGSNVSVLRLIGRGDPSFTTAQLQSLVQQLKNKGIRSVNQLIVDDGFFQGATVNSSWDAEDIQAGYGAPANSLILNQNAINLTLFPQDVGEPLAISWDNPEEGRGWQVKNTSRTVSENQAEFLNVGRDLKRPVLLVNGQLQAGSEPEPVSIAITEPAQNFVQKLRQFLTAQGITVKEAKIINNGFVNPEEIELAQIQSPPLKELIKHTNLESDNLYAEALLRLVGKLANPAKTIQISTVNEGLKAIEDTLMELNLNPNDYKLVDGSGLSRQNLTTPEGLVNLLQEMSKTPLAKIYQNSLPVAGISGTLTNRFRNSSAAGIVQAKTGYISGTMSLSGYINSPNYQPLAFSIIVNYSDLSTPNISPSIDQIILLLSRLRQC